MAHVLQLLFLCVTPLCLPCFSLLYSHTHTPLLCPLSNTRSTNTQTNNRSPQLTVNLPGGVAYCAVDTSLPAGAPLRTVTVRDAIQDLPVIENGHSE